MYFASYITYFDYLKFSNKTENKYKYTYLLQIGTYSIVNHTITSGY